MKRQSWPDPHSSATGGHMMQLLENFLVIALPAKRVNR